TELNELENRSESSWRLDSSELASAVKFADPHGTLAASSLSPDRVASQLRKCLLKTPNAQPAAVSAA
ncbi:MAG: hypothetical protein ACMG6H_07070, partial [Acidobacteriota bacterium]